MMMMKIEDPRLSRTPWDRGEQQGRGVAYVERGDREIEVSASVAWRHGSVSHEIDDVRGRYVDTGEDVDVTDDEIELVADWLAEDAAERAS